MSELAARLASIKGLAFVATYVGFEPGKWPHFKWAVTLKYKGREFATSYRTGIGHAKPGVSAKARGDIIDTPRGSMSRERAAQEGYLRPTKPDVADVVSSLLSDSRGALDPFEDWCAELGYATDSRKALATYIECQRTRTQMYLLFGIKLFVELSRLEH